MTRPILALALLPLMAAPALANDSVAEIGAGGLILVRADAVSMAREELYVSPSAIKVDYVFHNNSDQDQTYLVAFPMPDIDPADYSDSDNGVPDRDNDNFLDFKVSVEGREVTPQLEVKALSAGLDVTDRLKALGLPLNPLADATRAALSRVPAEKLKELQLLGAVYVAEDGASPLWLLHETYYWPQTFPANADLHVSHSYKPAVGGTFYSADTASEPYFRDRYCVDSSTAKAAAALLAAMPEDNRLLITRQVSYILTTGANWQGAIADFRLVVDKEDPNAIVSFCETGVSRISPTRFEVRKTDFTPEKDLEVLILARPDTGEPN